MNVRRLNPTMPSTAPLSFPFLAAAILGRPGHADPALRDDLAAEVRIEPDPAGPRSFVAASGPLLVHEGAHVVAERLQLRIASCRAGIEPLQRNLGQSSPP